MKVEKEEFSSVKIYNEVDFNGLKKSGELAARALEYIDRWRYRFDWQTMRKSRRQ